MADPRARVILESIRSGDAAFASFKADLEGIAVKAELVAHAIEEVIKVGYEYIKGTFESIESLAHQADALGVTTQALAGLRFAANLSGVEVDALNRALVRQTRTVYEASQGNAKAKDALAALGFNYQQLAQLSPDKQFEAIAEAVTHLGNTTERGGVVAEIYGAKNAAMINLLLRGKAGLQEISDETERFGTALSRIDAARVEVAIEAIKTAQEKVRGIGTIIAVEVAGDVTALANAFIDVGNEADGMRVAVRNSLNGIGTGVGLVLDAYYGWELIILKVKQLSLDYAVQQVNDFQRIRDSAIDLWNWMIKLGQTANPGAHTLKPFGTQGDIAQGLRDSAHATEEALNALVAAGAPSAKLAENVGAARAEAERLAQHIAAGAQNRLDTSANTPIDTSAADEAARQKAQHALDAAEKGVRQVNEAIAGGLEDELQIRKRYGLLSVDQDVALNAQLAARDEDAIKLRLNQQLEALRTGLQQKVITEQEFNDLSAQAAQQAQDRIDGILKRALTRREQFQKQSALNQASSVIDGLVALTSGVASTSRTMFNINKALAIASAVANTAQGITKAFAELGPWAWPVAAAIGAAGLAQIQAIRATSFDGSGGSGGGSVPSVSGGGASLAAPATAPAPPAASLARSGLNVYLTVQGSVIGEGGRTQLAEDLTKLLREHVDRTDDSLVTVTSRNGLDLAGAPA